MASATKEFDLAVLGGGPGGYVAAIRAAQLGMKVGVVEKEELGGVCLNWGCIPTKALLRSAEAVELVKHAKNFGLQVEKWRVDFPAIIKRSRNVSNRLVKGIHYLFRKNGIELIKGKGRLTRTDTLEVFDASGKGIAVVKAKHIILATGARPKSLPGIEFDGNAVITSKEAMTLQNQPKTMVIVGAGAIGVEFAYFYNALGTKVHLVEMMPSILPLEDKEITDILAKSLKKAGIEIYTEAKVESIEKRSGGVEVVIQKEDQTETLSGDVALVAIGVQANTEDLGLEEAGVELERGFIRVDKNYRTTADGIYAIGDVAGPPLLAHVASAEGIHCIERIAGMDSPPIDYQNFPSCTYCMPQVASVGLTEEKAREKGYELKIGRFPFRANGKALAYGESEGMVKLIFDAKYGELLGAHIVGPDATELIAELGVAKTLETTYYELHKTIHAHPTLSEAIMEAAAAADEGAIHI
jgi:dihydrolipoamide dehydrogenase